MARFPPPRWQSTRRPPFSSLDGSTAVTVARARRASISAWTTASSTAPWAAVAPPAPASAPTRASKRPPEGSARRLACHAMRRHRRQGPRLHHQARLHSRHPRPRRCSAWTILPTPTLPCQRGGVRHGVGSTAARACRQSLRPSRLTALCKRAQRAARMSLLYAFPRPQRRPLPPRCLHRLL